MANKPVVTPAIVYELPDGAKLYTKKPTNAIRRVLLEQPETNLRFLMEIIGAACVVKMELPEGYNENAEAQVLDFSDEELKVDCWKRLDTLTLSDTETFINAFQEQNLATREMVERVVAAVKSGKK